jgi:hypothetical protein
MRNPSYAIALALSAGLYAWTSLPVEAGSGPGRTAKEPLGNTSAPFGLTDHSELSGHSDSSHSDSREHSAPETKPTPPAQGTGCIIDTRGRVTHLKFAVPPGGFDREGWLKRVKDFEKRRAEARAENERLRLQWIAEERQRAREAADRQAALKTEASRSGGSDYGWILGGYGYRGGRKGHVRPHRPAKVATRPRPEPSKPIFLPAPNLTSPFPHSSTKDSK